MTNFPAQIGSTVVLKDGTRMLVGAVNAEGGVCDCCRIPDRDIERVEPPPAEVGE